MTSHAVAADSPSQPKGRIAPFGKYLLLQRVSVGGMAEIFKAIPEGAKRIDEIVAIKRILPNIAEDNEFIGMFIDEARIAGQLTHPNICRIYELGKVKGDHYIAMQFLWGRDLLKVMNRLKKVGAVLPVPMAAFIAAKACAALHYAHTKCDATGKPLGIIHRDVSPQNIIVGYSGQVKLIDFGVARAASQSQKTQAGILKGKFGYMSPEMIRSLPVDHRSDVFAMGICLHEALTGSRLFYGETDFATLEQVRDARVVPPSAKVAGIPPALDAIVLKALARDVEDRYASAAELERALMDFLDALYPGYGEADVGAGMRQAFAQEVQREKQRLDMFSNMLTRGELVRGANVPELPTEPPPSGERASLRSDAPPTPTDPLLSTQQDAFAPVHGDDEVESEQTQIFFSAEELSELRQIESEPLTFDTSSATPSGQIRQPAPSEIIMRNGSPAYHGQPARSIPPSQRPARPSGMYERPGGAPNFQTAELTRQQKDERRIPTMTFKAAADTTLDMHEEANKQAANKRLIQRALMAALALILVGAGFGLSRMAQTRTATLVIERLDDPDALVRIDGILRGNPPLSVTDLPAGVHDVTIDARGYEPVRISVHVEAGDTRTVRPVLQRADTSRALPTVESSPVAAAPVPATSEPLAPTTTALPPSDPQPAARAPVARAKAPRVQSGEGPSVERADVGETDIAESLNPETLAENQGELLISTLPWSRVFIDGVDSGRDTPVRSLRVPAGEHRIGLRTPDGVTHDVDVSVEAGKVVRIIRRF